MPKLTTRQLLILGVMLLAILYGAYDFFFTAQKKSAVATEKTATDLSAFLGNITATLTKDVPSPVVAYTVTRMEAEWPRDPFYEPRNDRDEEAVAKERARVEAEAAAVIGQLNYTGYVDMGQKKIAVVNGNEYVVGEALNVGGFVLSDIYPAKIIISNKQTGMTLEIPLQE
jgi:hypothetical protein